VAGINDSNATDSNDRSEIVVWGNCENNLPCGPVTILADQAKKRLAVYSIETTSSNVVYEDAQLARDTTPTLNVWTSAYTYTGVGKFYAAIWNLEGASGADGSKWYINIKIDNTFNMFGTNGLLISDATDVNIYNLLALSFDGISMNGNAITVDMKDAPILFTSKIEILFKRITSNKKFKAGLVRLSKD